MTNFSLVNVLIFSGEEKAAKVLSLYKEDKMAEKYPDPVNVMTVDQDGVIHEEIPETDADTSTFSLNCRRYVHLKIEADRIKKEMDSLKDKIIPELSKGDQVIVDGYKIMLRDSYVRHSVDSTKLKETYPQVFEDVQNETIVKPTLSVKECKGK